MYDKRMNYLDELDKTSVSIVSQIAHKYDVEINLAAYALDKMLKDDIVVAVLIDRGVTGIHDYLTPVDDEDMK